MRWLCGVLPGPKTMFNIHRTLSRALSDAAADGLPKTNPPHVARLWAAAQPRLPSAQGGRALGQRLLPVGERITDLRFLILIHPKPATR